MKNVLSLVVFLYACAILHGQHVGIGTNAPEAPLHVAGEIRTDSIDIVGPGGTSALLRAIAPYGQVDQYQNSGNDTYVPASGWQSFTAGKTGSLAYIEMNYDMTDVPVQMTLHAGVGTGGPVLGSFDYVSAEGWFLSPALNVQITAGQSYTIAVADIDHWYYNPNSTYAGGISQTGEFSYEGVDFKFRTYVTDYNGLTVSGSGQVGIGVPNPTAALEVKGRIETDLLQIKDGAIAGAHLISDDQGYASWIVPMAPWMVNGSNVYLTNTGNVGIGTNAPEEKLHVEGKLKVGSIAQDAPVDVQFFNGNFSNLGWPYENVTYYKDKEGRVHLSGIVSITGTQTGAMFILPENYRPSANLVFPAMTSSGNAWRINVNYLGHVTIQGELSGWVSMNGISFRAL